MSGGWEERYGNGDVPPAKCMTILFTLSLLGLV